MLWICRSFSLLHAYSDLETVMHYVCACAWSIAFYHCGSKLYFHRLVFGSRSVTTQIAELSALSLCLSLLRSGSSSDINTNLSTLRMMAVDEESILNLNLLIQSR